MKKYLVVLIFAFLVFLFLPKNTHAQGTFDCHWSWFACRPTNKSCEPDYKVDRQICKNFSDKSSCNLATGNMCIGGSVSTQSTQYLFCDNNGNPSRDPSSGKIYTAVGCIQANNQDQLISQILSWAIGIGGGIAFLLIILASFMIMTSSGNPERQKAGQELLTSAIAGLIMLIFSVFILKVIGVDILRLPGIS